MSEFSTRPLPQERSGQLAAGVQDRRLRAEPRDPAEQRGRRLHDARRQDPRAVDGARGHRLQEVHLGLRRLELRHRHVGGEWDVPE